MLLQPFFYCYLVICFHCLDGNKYLFRILQKLECLLNRHLCNNLFWSFILLIQMKIPLFYAVRVVLVFIFWYHNNVLLSSMPGRTRKSTVSNTFPVSLQCRQKRYQLDAILLPMGGSSWMVSVSFLLWCSRFPVFRYREKRHKEL